MTAAAANGIESERRRQIECTCTRKKETKHFTNHYLSFTSSLHIQILYVQSNGKSCLPSFVTHASQVYAYKTFKEGEPKIHDGIKITQFTN